MIQYRVTWFPEEGRTSASQPLSEKTDALRIFKNAKDAGYWPIMEERTVLPWEITRNARDEAQNWGLSVEHHRPTE